MIADAQEANYQQALAGIVCNLVSMAIYLSRNRDFNRSDISVQINTAKAAVYENISTITPERLAEITCIAIPGSERSSRNTLVLLHRSIFRKYASIWPRSC